VLGRQLPSYDLFLIVIGPLVLLVLHFALARTRFGRLVRAATQDREMVGALGVNQAVLFTSVFALGAALAGLGGALQVAREPANLATDLVAIGDAFVVVVVGGMGSITGAYLAAVIIAEVKAICIGIGVVDFGFVTVNFSKLTLVAEFLVMAVVLIARPYGLLGRPQAQVRSIAEPEDPIRPATPALKMLGEEVRTDSPLDVTVEVDPQAASLLASRSHDIVQLTREALSNVARHAHARRAWVRLATRDGKVMLTVEDDGVGFDPRSRTGGNGLRNMRGRAAALHGDFRVSARSGGGTRLRLTVPA